MTNRNERIKNNNKYCSRTKYFAFYFHWKYSRWLFDWLINENGEDKKVSVFSSFSFQNCFCFDIVFALNLFDHRMNDFRSFSFSIRTHRRRRLLFHFRYHFMNFNWNCGMNFKNKWRQMKHILTFEFLTDKVIYYYSV